MADTAITFMHQAAERGLMAPHTPNELAVGCIITDQNNTVIATGYSREDGHEKSHAEDIAIRKLPDGIDGSKLTLYSTVEPCGTRLSAGPTCTRRIIESGIRTVIYAMHEPAHFVHQNGLQQMRDIGMTVTHVCNDQIFEMVSRANPHIKWL